MIFDPADPFPTGSPSYEEAKAHAEAADTWLGLDTARVEAELTHQIGHQTVGRGQELWIGLPIQSLLTPYIEIRQMLEELAPQAGMTIVDLGAGYGRMGFVIARCFPGVRFIGYELVEKRVTEGARALKQFGTPPNIAELRQADLSAPNFKLPDLEGADAYFIYDYGSREAITKSLSDLRACAARRPITVVGRGRLTRDTIERSEPWLSQVVKPQHVGNFSIYRSAR